MKRLTGIRKADALNGDNRMPLHAQSAFLFKSPAGKYYAVSLRSSGDNLPPPLEGSWTLLRQFQLGVQMPVPSNIDPEPILRGITADGYFIWEVERGEPFGTSQ